MIKKNAFTMIELLIVISIIGVLAGVLITVIDPDYSKKLAENGVRQSNLQKLSEGLEAFHVGEGRLPASATSGNPFDGTDTVLLGTYLNSWPVTSNSASVFYYSNSDATICVSVPMATDTTKHYKYVGEFNTATGSDAERDCAGKVIVCTSACPNNELKNCSRVDETSCAT